MIVQENRLKQMISHLARRGSHLLVETVQIVPLTVLHTLEAQGILQQRNDSSVRRGNEARDMTVDVRSKTTSVHNHRVAHICRHATIIQSLA